MWQLNENPRLGLRTSENTLHPGFWPTQSSTALGDSWSVAQGSRRMSLSCDFGACGSSNLLGSAGVVMSHYPFNPQTIVPELIFLKWWRNQTTKTHGLWTHGNWCGAGGSGYPVDGHDTNCMMHDYCYNRHGFSPGSNFDTLSLDQRAALQGCNRQLCSAEKQLGGWTANQITGYFSIAPSNGNGCWAGPQ